MNYSIPTPEEVRSKIWEKVHETPAFDIHTTLYDSRFEDDLQRTGIDELLTSDELSDELFRYSPRSLSNPNKELTREEFDILPLRIRSELIWHRLFLANTPLSESTRAVLTTIGLLGLDPKTRNLGAYRSFFNRSSKAEKIDTIIAKSNLESIVTCYNPLKKSVQKALELKNTDKRFYSALDMTELISNWKSKYSCLSKLGFEAKRTLDKNNYPIIRNYLSSLITNSKPVYFHLTLPSGMSFTTKGNNTLKLLIKCLIPVLCESSIALSLTFTEAKQSPTLNSLKLNQSLQFSNIDFITELSEMFPGLRLMITDYNYENQYALTLLSKKNHNIMPMNSMNHLSAPSAFKKITLMHFDQLGSSFIAHTSNADVYEKLLPEWAHSRWMLAEHLQQRYTNLYRTGWQVTEDELDREIYNLLSGNAKKFINIK